MFSMAIERNEPPPATALSTPGKKVATTNQTHRQLIVAALTQKVHKADCI